MSAPAPIDADATDLPPLTIRGRRLLPIVQGGMGVGVSAHRLAGSVAALGAVGTISSVDLRRHHPDLMERTHDLLPGEAATRRQAAINAANLEALEREIRAARALAGGRGLLAVNVMRAVARVRALGQARAGMRHRRRGRRRRAAAGPARPGAGPPRRRCWCRSCPTRAACSCSCKKWERKKRLPDAIVIEHPRLAGGHLGAAKIADLDDPRFDFENVIPEALAFLRAAGIATARFR